MSKIDMFLVSWYEGKNHLYFLEGNRKGRRHSLIAESKNLQSSYYLEQEKIGEAEKITSIC